MITNFKIFEQVNIGEPEVGDYVILDLEWTKGISKSYFNIDNYLDNYLNNNIGQISKITKDGEYLIFKILFENPPIELVETYLQNNKISVYKSQIKHISTDRKDLEAILAQQKYNL